MDVNAIKELLSNSGALAEKIPGPQQILNSMGQILLVLMRVGPVVMMVMGLLYCFAAPKEANHHFGYRCYYGMGSVEAWRFTQKMAGITWMVLGVVLLLAMLVARMQFAGLDTMSLVLGAVVCVLIQATVLVLASLLIRITVFFRFDRHGNRRRDKRKPRKFERCE